MPSLVTIRPSRISVCPSNKAKTALQHYHNSLDKLLFPSVAQSSLDNLKKAKNSFKLSKATRRKIFDTINNLYTLSSPRTITMANGKSIYNFRCSFVTLTLPSSQNHSDTFIKNKCLNQFLVEVRKHYRVENYFWKAEIQNNENIHFHIILDKYIDFQALRRRWNRCLEKYGYVSEYSKKFAAMSLRDYAIYRNRQSKTDFATCQKAYAAGRKCNWSNPNTVDVRSVRSKRQLAGYLAKYLAKPSQSAEGSDEPIQRAIDFGRAWARSQSLSRLKYQNKIERSEIEGLLKYLAQKSTKATSVISEWFTCFYFNLADLDLKVQRWIEKMVRSNARLYAYPFP